MVRNMGTIGGSLANNDPAADYPGAVLCVGAVIHTNRREIAADDFFTGMFSTALDSQEIQTAITFPLPEAAGYFKLPHPASGYVLCGAFVARGPEGVRVAVNGAGPCVFRDASAEAALADRFYPETAKALAFDAEDFTEDLHADKHYRAQVLPAVIRQATERALAKGDQFTDAFLALNPRAVVPVLVHDGRIITESTIINEYIAEAFDGPSLMPADPWWRARKRYWSMLLDTGLHSPHTTVLSFVIALRFAFLKFLDTPQKIEAHLKSVRDPASRERQREAFELGYEAQSFRTAVFAFDALLEEMEDALAKSPWLAGDALSLADLDMAPYVHRLDTLGLSNLYAERPHVAEWYNRLQARPSWKTAITDAHDANWLELMAVKGRDAWPEVSALLKA
ncbi:hypothetical protein DDZ14_14335 [Maritimibacter sp. 55A14]|uniref:FAD binding domain-containing protein n=1 Tax=Maritimibacter sp. 55A14 TaxID=2174844 RepID=UPI000D61B131|nr:FAD binding domain-containing protein [Maritimibacter sp. 55A14]PWE31193.1 hypothetical protein DDZ14_14335 [Maritimibacter sp. 55A14]